MKLKKIASLALAGVMAVSMLAGCNNGSSSNGDNGNADVTTNTSIVDAVNKGQSVANNVKITFTADSALDSALKRAAEKLGVSANDTKLAEAVTNMTGLTAVEPHKNWKDGGFVVSQTNFLGGNVDYSKNYTPDSTAGGENIGSEDGVTYTVYGVVSFEGDNYPTEESVLNTVAKEADEIIAKLSKTSNLDSDGKLDVTTGNKYYSYSYDGNISMVSVEQLDGTVDYYVAYVVNQTIAEKKL